MLDHDARLRREDSFFQQLLLEIPLPPPPPPCEREDDLDRGYTVIEIC